MHMQLEALTARYPELSSVCADVQAVCDCLAERFRAGGKLLLCGNGGSAADCEHIVGELMKGFLKQRPLAAEQAAALQAAGLEEPLCRRLQGALPAVSLTGHAALRTAVANDSDPALVFAQQVFGLGRPGDALLAISTSGNAENVAAAAKVARAQGMATIALTGRGGGALAPLCEYAIRVPADETYRVQEYHLPVYHTLCAMLEDAFFAG